MAPCQTARRSLGARDSHLYRPGTQAARANRRDVRRTLKARRQARRATRRRTSTRWAAPVTALELARVSCFLPCSCSLRSLPSRRGRSGRSGRAEWRLEQPASHVARWPGIEHPDRARQGRRHRVLGANRGLLITAGNPPTIPPGVWAYTARVARARDRLRRDGRADSVGRTRRILDRLGRPTRQASSETTARRRWPTTRCALPERARPKKAKSRLPMRRSLSPRLHQAIHARAACRDGLLVCRDVLPQGQVGRFTCIGTQLADGDPQPAGAQRAGHAGVQRISYESVRLLPTDSVRTRTAL